MTEICKKCGHDKERHGTVCWSTHILNPCKCKKFEAQKGCGMDILVENNNKRKCGEKFWNKIRLCLNCKAQNHSQQDCVNCGKPSYNHLTEKGTRSEQGIYCDDTKTHSWQMESSKGVLRHQTKSAGTFNLSKKIIAKMDGFEWIHTGDVKEFIKRLKEEIYKSQLERIDKLAGDELR